MYKYRNYTIIVEDMSGNRSLHIISLEIPHPPERGSVMGIFHRLRAFKDAGVEIILHTFYKEFKASSELTDLCKTIYFYPRYPMWKIKNLAIPLYIQSRRSNQIIEVLLRDESPILFEGLHTLYHFNDPKLAERKKYVRMHNIESEYYFQLAKFESNPIKKLYYQFESNRSKSFEQHVLPLADGIFAISNKELISLSSINDKTVWIPPFISQDIRVPQGVGSYALFHGDLSIRENEIGVKFLIRKIFKFIELPLVIAGYRPSLSLKRLIKKHPSITLLDSPDAEKMDALISDAQILLCPFLQDTGYKMKLLHSMVRGRHLMTSSIVRSYSELIPILHIAETPEEWMSCINKLKQLEVMPEQIDRRKKLLNTWYNNEINANRMLQIMYNE